MQIVYVLDWKFSAKSGVCQKIQNQIAEWRKLGAKVELWVICPQEKSSEWSKQKVKLFTYNSQIGRARKRKYVVKKLQKLSLFSFIYTRFGIFTPSQIWYFRKMNMVYEVNTEIFKEYKYRSKALHLYLKLTAPTLFKNSLGVCAVTNQIASDIAVYIGEKVKCFPNSIALTNSLINSKKITNNLIFVGSSGNDWHGLDYIETLAKLLPEYEFLIVGSQKNSQLTNLHYLGEKYDMELTSVISNCLAGISSLKLEKIQMTEASPLKTRFYLSNGLPVITGYKDSAFPQGAEFIFRLPPRTEEYSPVVISELRKFLKSWKNKRVQTSALINIDSTYVEANRIRFFIDLLKANQ